MTMNNNLSVSLSMVAHPGELECVLQQIAKIDGTEIQSSSDEGQLLVMVAARDNDELYRRVDILQFVEGVQISSLTYH